MKFKLFLALTLSTFVFSCTKHSDMNPKSSSSNPSKTESVNNVKKSSGANQKMALDGENGCVIGAAYCTEFCCVTPSVVQGYKNAIDNGSISTFLSQDNIDELSQGDQDIIDLLEDARDGNTEVIYQESSVRIGFLYGSNVTTNAYEFAHVINH